MDPELVGKFVRRPATAVLLNQLRLLSWAQPAVHAVALSVTPIYLQILWIGTARNAVQS
ncbi:hypothetical protein [Mycolicibacterium agri]|uniref:hypothetical protein n=1 Tax=Mycolicibacterium agri TaxID=36811 RepID=UPI001A9C50B6|nr:hypothetical protein [Mycolicibacterium agri]